MSRREQRLILRILRRRWRAVRRLLHERRRMERWFFSCRNRLVAEEMAAMERKTTLEIAQSWGGT